MGQGAKTSNDGALTAAIVAVTNRAGASGIIIACEHASNFIPPEFENLGIDDKTQQSHIAWDIGALAVAKEMSALLDAPLVAQCVSRLVYDCNRSFDARDTIIEKSEIYDVPGNKSISATERTERKNKYYEPFRNELAEIIKSRTATSKSVALITIHSFSPVFDGEKRNMDIGIIHDSDSRLADEIITIANSDKSFDIRRNEPYGPDDDVTFTLAEHAVSQGLLNVMIEIRNDLIADSDAQKSMAQKLANYITSAVNSICNKSISENFPCCASGN